MSHQSRPFTFVLGLAGALALAAPASAQDTAVQESVSPQATAPQPDEVVARIGDREFTNADVAIAAEDISETLNQLPAQQRKSYILTYLADLERIAGKAEEAGVQDREGFQQRMQYMRNRALMETYLQQLGQDAATDEAARELYKTTVTEAEPQEEVRASHILVPTEEEANDLKQQLDEGADFAELAKEHSQDPGSAPKGGDLGYFGKEQMVPAFSEAAFSLEPGTVSDPVESQFGWHIIKVQDKREQEPPAYDEVEGQLKQMLARQAQRDEIMALREQSKLEVVGQESGGEAGASGDAPEGESSSQ